MNKLILSVVSLALSLPALGAKARTVFLSDTEMGTVRMVPGRSTVLSFPTRPTKVVLGNQGLFAVEYIENDLAIAALRFPAQSNLFVYMEGRRFSFDLRTQQSGGDEIILVRDAISKKGGRKHE